MTRKICVVTGSRAEYGLLKWLMKEIEASDDLLLQVVVTGMHLSPEFGLTYREIEQDGFRIDRRVESLLSADTGSGVGKSIGLGVIGFSDVLEDLKPDIMVVLGDRFEILAAVCAALPARVPVAHLHGGERTEGAVDDAIRHAITKMAHLHFVAAPPYRQRILQMGEAADRTFCVGGLGIDAILRTPLLDRAELERALGFSFDGRTLLVTYHPETLGTIPAEQQITALLDALAARPDIRALFTLPNADMDGRAITRKITDFVAARPDCRVHASLGQRNYLSCLQFVDGVVGNSSSGLLEVPSFHKGAVNIGDRQRGRLRAASVIDCPIDVESIGMAIDRLYDPAFRRSLEGMQNPYGDGGAAIRVADILRSVDLRDLLRKPFIDIPGSEEAFVS